MLKIQHKNFNKDRFWHKYKMFFTVYPCKTQKAYNAEYGPLLIFGWPFQLKLPKKIKI